MEIWGRRSATNRSSFELAISNIECVKEFAGEVGFTILRKSQNLEDALSIIAGYEVKDRSARWKKLYRKVRGEWVRRDLTRT